VKRIELQSGFKSDFMDSASSKDPKKLGHFRHLTQAFDLEEADMLIFLAVAEKLQPAVYAFVTGENSLQRRLLGTFGN
jgi:hypothetical protein